MQTQVEYWRGFPDSADRRRRSNLQVAVLIPCFNKQQSIGKVVEDFRDVLPRTAIYVYDNNSADPMCMCWLMGTTRTMPRLRPD